MSMDESSHLRHERHVHSSRFQGQSLAADESSHLRHERHVHSSRFQGQSLAAEPSDDCTSGAHSHSIVDGGFDVMSSTTRFTAGTSLTIRDEIVSSRSYGSRAQSAVIASSLVTARTTTG
jgi:hypothetical protein